MRRSGDCLIWNSHLGKKIILHFWIQQCWAAAHLIKFICPRRFNLIIKMSEHWSTSRSFSPGALCHIYGKVGNNCKRISDSGIHICGPSLHSQKQMIDALTPPGPLRKSIVRKMNLLQFFPRPTTGLLHYFCLFPCRLHLAQSLIVEEPEPDFGVGW